MYLNKIKWAALVSFAALTAISCSSNKDKNEVPSVDNTITIRSVKYINEDNITDIDVVSSSDGSSAKVATATQNTVVAGTLDIQKAVEFDYTADLLSNAKAKVITSGGVARAKVPFGFCRGWSVYTAL